MEKKYSSTTELKRLSKQQYFLSPVLTMEFFSWHFISFSYVAASLLAHFFEEMDFSPFVLKPFFFLLEEIFQSARFILLYFNLNMNLPNRNQEEQMPFSIMYLVCMRLFLVLLESNSITANVALLEICGGADTFSCCGSTSFILEPFHSPTESRGVLCREIQSLCNLKADPHPVMMAGESARVTGV